MVTKNPGLRNRRKFVLRAFSGRLSCPKGSRLVSDVGSTGSCPYVLPRISLVTGGAITSTLTVDLRGPCVYTHRPVSRPPRRVSGHPFHCPHVSPAPFGGPAPRALVYTFHVLHRLGVRTDALPDRPGRVSGHDSPVAGVQQKTSLPVVVGVLQEVQEEVPFREKGPPVAFVHGPGFFDVTPPRAIPAVGRSEVGGRRLGGRSRRSEVWRSESEVGGW